MTAESISGPAAVANRSRLAVWATERVLVVGLLVLVAVTLIVTVTQSSYTIFIWDSSLLACVGALSMQLLQGTAGLVSVGGAAFLMVGAFGSVAALRLGIPFPADILVATIAAGAVGLLTAVPALRLASLFFAIGTLAIFFIVLFLGTLYQSSVPSAAVAGFFVPVLFGSAGPRLGSIYWAWLLLAIVIGVLALVRWLMSGRSGRALRMMRDHEMIAPTFGIDTAFWKLGIFSLSSMLFGLEGGLLAHLTGNVVTDEFTLTVSFQYVVMILIGGLDTISGALLGAIVVTTIPLWVSDALTALSGASNLSTYAPDVSQVIYGMLVVIFVTVERDGLVGIVRAVSSAAYRRFLRLGPRGAAGRSHQVNATGEAKIR